MERKGRDTSYSNFVMKLMLVCTILILGSAIIFSFNSALKKDKKDNKQEEELTSEEKLINKLYGYVTFGRDEQLMNYFYQFKELTTDTFDGLEKVKYAFNLLEEDKLNKIDDKTYSIDADIYNGYIKTMFGENTTYDNSKEVSIFTNKILKNSIMTISFDKEKNQYIISRINGFKKTNEQIKPFYYKLEDYNIDNANKQITINEKFIFVEKEISENGKDITGINIYKDIYHEKILKSIDYPSASQIEKFNYNDYIKDGGSITYTFKLDNNNNYYFYSSNINE